MKTLGPFKLERLLGRGGMGEVWQAVHGAQATPVAIKMMTGQHARSPAFVAAFEREVRAVASLDHRGIAAVYDYGTVSAPDAAGAPEQLLEGSPYLAMELASGALSEALLPLGPAHFKAVLFALLDALAHAHAKGVIHRDLKTANVLYFGDSAAGARFKLTDFGIAHSIAIDRGEGMIEHTISGTPHFMSPEQFTGRWREYGPWTDLYSLGCMAFELATGRLPFEGRSAIRLFQQHKEAPFPALDSPAPGYPPELDAWLQRLCAKAPHERFQRAADAAWALHAIMSEAALPAPDATPGELHLKTSSYEVPLSWQTTRLFSKDGGPRAEDPTTPHRPSALALETLVLPAMERASSPSEAKAQPAGAALASRTDRVPLALPWAENWRRPDHASLPDRAMRARALHGVGLGLFGLRPIPLADRIDERDRLWSALTQVHQSGMAKACVLRGAAGFGKSRLAEWICERAHELGAATIFRATHGPAPAPTHGLAPMAARHLQTLGLGGFDVRTRVIVHLGQHAVDDDLEARLLTSLLPRVQNEDALANLVVFQQPRERWAVLLRLLERVADERPLIVWLDDVQWGADALEFVDYALQRQNQSGALPALFVLTVRDEALAQRAHERSLLEKLCSLAHVDVLEIGALPGADHSELIASMLSFDEALTSRVRERTAGNPLFAVQLVGDWVNRGIVVATDAGFRLAAGTDVALPDDLFAVWSARIERLLEASAPSSRRALELGAALGQEVDADEWRALLALAGLSFPDALVAALLKQQLFKAEGRQLAFAHGMLRESVLRTAREHGRLVGHHTLCATWLTNPDSAGTARRDERLGMHQIEAGLHLAAVDSLLRGATDCEERSELIHALYLLERCEDALALASADERDARRGQLSVLKATLLSTQRQEEAYALASSAEQQAQRFGWSKVRADALECMARICRKRIELSRAQALSALARQAYQELGDQLGEARAVQSLGVTLLAMGDLQRALAHNRGRESRLSGPPSLRTVRAVLPHTALRSVVYPA